MMRINVNNEKATTKNANLKRLSQSSQKQGCCDITDKMILGEPTGVSSRKISRLVLVLVIIALFRLYASISRTTSHSLNIPAPCITRKDQIHADESSSRNQQSAHREEVQHDLEWCPFAKCENSPLCQPCRKRFLLIVAGFRTGSTSMREMMDRLPGVRIGGENLDLLFGTHQLLNNHRDIPWRAHKNTSSAWFRHPDRKSDYACMTQNIIDTFYPPAPHVQQNSTLLRMANERSIIGFKTIRLHRGNWSADDAVQFIRANLPCSRIIVNINSERPKKSLNVTPFATKFGTEQAFLIDSALYKTNSSQALQQINNLVYWLGFRGCNFSSLLHANNKAKDGKMLNSDTDTELDLGPSCRYNGSIPTE